MTDRQSAASIEEEAARWVLWFDRNGHSDASQGDLDAWLAGDSRRRGALLQAEAAWLALDAAGEGQADAASTADEAQQEHGERGRFLSRRSLLAGLGSAAAASVAAAVYIGWSRGDFYETTIGEVRRVPLADRSTMAINTGSRITVAYADKRRSVSIEQGEAWFQVAKNKAKPFVVSAGPVRVEAVGTAFSVRRRDKGADVLVTEGVVRVWVTGDEAQAVRLGAGSALFISDDAAVTLTPDSAPSIDRKLAWRAGKMNLEGETLGEAAEEFNRYTKRPIVIRDPVVAGKRLYGVFRLDDPEGFATTAAVTLGVAAWQQDNRIMIAAHRD